MGHTYAKLNKETLRFIRDTKRISYEYIARIVKFSEDKVKAWEDNESTKLPTIKQAKDLAKCYRIPFAGFYMNSEDINVKHLPRFINKRTMIGAGTDDSAVNLALLDLLGDREFLLETKETLSRAPVAARSPDTGRRRCPSALTRLIRAASISRSASRTRFRPSMTWGTSTSFLEEPWEWTCLRQKQL